MVKVLRSFVRGPLEPHIRGRRHRRLPGPADADSSRGRMGPDPGRIPIAEPAIRTLGTQRCPPSTTREMIVCLI